MDSKVNSSEKFSLLGKGLFSFSSTRVRPLSTMQREFYRRKLYHRFAEIISERHFGPKVPKWTKIHLFCVDNVAQCTYGIWRAPGTQFWPNEYGGGPKIEKQLGSFSSIFDVKRPLQIYLLKNTFTFKGLHNFSFPKHVCQIVGRNIDLICFALKGGWCLNHLSALPPWLLELTSPSKAFTGKYVDRH